MEPVEDFFATDDESSCSDDDDVGSDGSNVDMTGAADADAGPDPGAAPPPQPKPRKPRKPHHKIRREDYLGGTVVDKCVRLMCYCAKHRPAHAVRPPPPGAAAARVPSAAAEGKAAAAGAGAGASGAADNGLAAEGSAQPVWPDHNCGCARAAPYNPALRRGLREPDVIAAAEAKRKFVHNVLYSTLAMSGARKPPAIGAPPLGAVRCAAL